MDKEDIAKQTLLRSVVQAIEEKLCGEATRFSGFLQGENKSHQLFSCVGNRNIVMLALGAFFSKISGEGRIPMADVFSSIVKGKTQISGAAFLHAGVAVGKLPRLVCGGRYKNYRFIIQGGVCEGTVGSYRMSSKY